MYLEYQLHINIYTFHCVQLLLAFKTHPTNKKKTVTVVQDFLDTDRVEEAWLVKARAL